MLLINFYEKASVVFKVPKGLTKLMLFLFVNMKVAVFLSFVFLLPLISTAQNLDSLYAVVKSIKNDSVKLRQYNKLGFSYIFNDAEKAKTVILEGKQLAEKAKMNFSIAELNNTYGIYMDITGQSDSAKYYFEKALKLSHKFKFESIESMCINNLGMFNWNRGNFNEALSYFFRSLKMDENQGREKSTASSLNNIGLIYQEMNLSEKALEYHYKALAVREKFDLTNEQISSLNNIGINLRELGRVNEAIEIYKKGILLCKSTKNKLEFYRLMDNLGSAYIVNGNYDLAIASYQEALSKSTDLNVDEKSKLSIYSNLVAIYNAVDNPKMALMYAEKGFEIIKKFPETEIKSAELNLQTAESYYRLGNFKKGKTYTETFVRLRDSLFSEQNAQAVANLEVTYDTQKKEKEILVQRAELAENKLTIQQKNYQLYGLLGISVLLLLIGFLFYNQQKLKNQQLKKENELKDALIKIETQNRLQEQRLRISRDLHDNIGAQLTFIISSIDNLKYGLDGKDEKIHKKLGKISEFTSATIYELRDTIWAMNMNEISIEDLEIRISNFIDKAHLYDDNIKFSFKIEDSVNQERSLTSVEGMNLHRIIQEAIHNSLKHAEPKEIRVHISEEKKNKLKVVISDDGNGFNAAEVETGNGLANMNKRAEHIGANFSIYSKPGNGTIVTIQM